jgi:TolA-binding protein
MIHFRRYVRAASGACLLSLATFALATPVSLGRPALNAGALADTNAPAEEQAQRIHQLEGEVAQLQARLDAAQAQDAERDAQLAAEQARTEQLQAQVQGLLDRHAAEDKQQAAALAGLAACVHEAGKPAPPGCTPGLSGLGAAVQGTTPGLSGLGAAVQGGTQGMSNGTVCPVTPAGQTPPPGCN